LLVSNQQTKKEAKMQIGKFTFKDRKWFYNDRQLANPIVIIWKFLWIIPVYVSLAAFAVTVALFNLDVGELERVWKDNQ
jgi:hypothetical protein